MYKTIIKLKNINSNSLILWNIQLVIIFQERVLSGQEHGLIYPFSPIMASSQVPGRLESPGFLNITAEGQKDHMFPHLEANPNSWY